jgi:hypothetical protein
MKESKVTDTKPDNPEDQTFRRSVRDLRSCQATITKGFVGVHGDGLAKENEPRWRSSVW